MALFFDKEWFEARLSAVHLSRADFALALGLNETEIAEVWKDQRELSARDVSLMAALLNVPAAEIAKRAGISTPVPRENTLADLVARLERIEQKLDELLKR